MSRPPSKFVESLSSADQKWLENTWRSHRLHIVRSRAHAVLLSHQGFTIKQLAQMFLIEDDTARAWVDRWLSRGRSGLEDDPRSGAPPKLTQQEQTLAVEILEKHPSEPRVVIHELAEKTGKQISRSTLRRIAHKAGLRWKRFRKTLKYLRNECAFRRAKAELADLQAMPNVDVTYFDEATFSLSAVVPYGWQQVGTRAEIPLSGKRQSVHVLAMQSVSRRRVVAFLHRGSIKGRTVIRAIDDFSKRLRRITVLVLDNASPHTCREVLAHQDDWEKRRLILYPLPPYSPELNHIENLWKEVKYHKLPATAWNSVKALIENLTRAFRTKGRVVLLPSLKLVSPAQL